MRETPPPLGREVPPSDWERLPGGLQILTNAARQLAEEGLLVLPAGITVRETPHSHFFACPSPDGRKITFHECFGPFIEALNREIDRYPLDLLIIAPPPRSRLHRLFLGDTTRKLALELHTSVLIVRGGTPGKPPGYLRGRIRLGQAFLPPAAAPAPLHPAAGGIFVGAVSQCERDAVAQAEHCLTQAEQSLKPAAKRAGSPRSKMPIRPMPSARPPGRTPWW